MADQRTLKQKLFQRDPRSSDLTLHGRVFNIGLRLVGVLLTIGLLLLAMKLFQANFWIVALILVVMNSILSYWADQFVINHWTHEAEKQKLDQKVRETTEKALKDR